MHELYNCAADVLRDYFSGETTSGVDDARAARLLDFASSQGLVSVFYSQLRLSGACGGSMDFYRRAVISRTALYFRRLERLEQLCGSLKAAGISAVLVKGLAVRRHYPQPELRPSADEDFVILNGALEKAVRAAGDIGFSAQGSFGGEARLICPETGLLVELSDKFFPANDPFSASAQRFFERDAAVVSAEPALELSPGYHLIYLICHCFKHFIRGGFGVRMLLDVGVLSSRLEGEISAELLLSALSELGLTSFAADLLWLCSTLFGLDAPGLVGALESYKTENALSLYYDMCEAGLHGKNGLHAQSGAVTLKMASGGSLARSSIRRLFPPKSELLKSGSQPEDGRAAYLRALFRRFARFFKNGRTAGYETLEISKKRFSLISEYLDRPHPADSAVVSALLERLSTGEQARLKVTGSSMLPLLCENRDEVILKRADKEPSPGDIVLYFRSSRLILHRLLAVKKSGLYFAGDAQRHVEGPVEPDKVRAVCTHIVRKGRVYSTADPRLRAYSALWRLVRPLRPQLIRLYAKISRKNFGSVKNVGK